MELYPTIKSQNPSICRKMEVIMPSKTCQPQKSKYLIFMSFVKFRFLKKTHSVKHFRSCFYDWNKSLFWILKKSGFKKSYIWTMILKMVISGNLFLQYLYEFKMNWSVFFLKIKSCCGKYRRAELGGFRVERSWLPRVNYKPQAKATEENVHLFYKASSFKFLWNIEDTLFLLTIFL